VGGLWVANHGGRLIVSLKEWWSVNKIKVVLAINPGLLRDFLRELIQCQTDMEVVGEVVDPVNLLLAVGETDADVVVVTLAASGEAPGICSHLLTEYPQLFILALSPERERAFLWRQSVSEEQLSIESDEEIVAAIRRVRV
jgi:DNA-binding NarL/FixJ family response regulator